MKNKKYVFITSMILTIIIFFIGFMLSYGLDFFRIHEIVNIVQDNELTRQSYVLEQDVVQAFGEDKCVLLNKRILELKTKISKVGVDLSKYSGNSIFKKADFDYLKRKYFLLELEFYDSINRLNSECGKNYFPVVYFYKIDDTTSERQGFVLDDLSQYYRNLLVVLSFDGEYDDEPALKVLKKAFNVTSYPTIIIDNRIIITSLTYTSELNTTLYQVINDDGIDKYAPKNMMYAFDVNGINISAYNASLQAMLNDITLSPFARGDILLVLGRINNDSTIICSSLKYYDNVSSDNIIEKALAYESIAAIGCGRNKRAFYTEASKLWSIAGNTYRADVDAHLALQMTPPPRFNTSLQDEILRHAERNPQRALKNISAMTLGESYFAIGDETVVTQADRVTRDWLGLQYQDPYADTILTTFSERLTYTGLELTEVGWHEGGRIRDLGVTPHIAAGVLVRKINDTWYAANVQGVYMFEVPLDKVMYPTTRFLRDDLAVIIDSHGVNMLVERAELLHATLVIGCCDHIGKVAAAKYLSDKGVNVICFTDKYLPLLLNQNASVLGSPPIQISARDAARNNSRIIVGNQSITITSSDSILALNVSADGLARHALSYYNTPALYFSQVENQYAGLHIQYHEIDDFNQLSNFTRYAEKTNATVLAVRVFTDNDYAAVAAWLNESKTHQAILFHSAAYPSGMKLFKEYAGQTTFDDINPKVQE